MTGNQIWFSSGRAVFLARVLLSLLILLALLLATQHAADVRGSAWLASMV